MERLVAVGAAGVVVGVVIEFIDSLFLVFDLWLSFNTINDTNCGGIVDVVDVDDGIDGGIRTGDGVGNGGGVGNGTWVRMLGSGMGEGVMGKW